MQTKAEDAGVPIGQRDVPVPDRAILKKASERRSFTAKPRRLTGNKFWRWHLLVKPTGKIAQCRGAAFAQPHVVF